MSYGRLKNPLLGGFFVQPPTTPGEIFEYAGSFYYTPNNPGWLQWWDALMSAENQVVAQQIIANNPEIFVKADDPATVKSKKILAWGIGCIVALLIIVGIARRKK